MSEPIRMPSLSRVCTSNAGLVALSLSTALALVGCGGGSSNTQSTQGAQEALQSEAMMMSGTVIVEERGGRTVFDGWFEQTSAEDLDSAVAPQAITEDACRFVSHSSASEHLADHLDAELEYIQSPPELGAAKGYASIGESIQFQSRVGEFDSLIKQVSGDTIVYAQEDRWQSDSIPDDSMLVFENISAFGNLDSATIQPLLPLVWLAPETGVLSNAATALRWEPSFDEQVKISIRLSAIDFRNSENPVAVSVSCEVVDDGLFTLPAEYQQLLPDDDSKIAVYAVRERVERFVGDAVDLTVKQLSYPAPINP